MELYNNAKWLWQSIPDDFQDVRDVVRRIEEHFRRATQEIVTSYREVTSTGDVSQIEQFLVALGSVLSEMGYALEILLPLKVELYTVREDIRGEILAAATGSSYEKGQQVKQSPEYHKADVAHQAVDSLIQWFYTEMRILQSIQTIVSDVRKGHALLLSMEEGEKL